MQLNAYVRTVKDILTLERKYVIPRFQREYAWELDELSQFKEDIFNNIKENEDKTLKTTDYFIGSLVLIGDDQKNEKEFLVVDGQQRLTTITIIFSVLNHIFIALKEENLAQSCYKHVEGKDENEKEFFKLLNESSGNYFKEYIQNKEEVSQKRPKTPEEKKLQKAYDYFREEFSKEKLKNYWGEIDTIEILKSIRNQILDFKTIYLTVDSLEDAYIIFETLNAKGKDLEMIDLVKNKIFQELTKDHPVDKAKMQWEEIKKTLGTREKNELFSQFFRHYWISKYNHVTKKELYKSFVKNIKKGEYSDFLNDLKDEAINYSKISNPEVKDWRRQEEKIIYNSLNGLKVFKVQQTRILLLALLKIKKEKKINLKEFILLIKMIEKFHFLYNGICSLNPSGIENKYSTIARKLRGSTSTNEIKENIEDLKKYYIGKKPTFEQFLSNFQKLDYTKHKNLIVYIFRKMEETLLGTDELKVNNITLEHISPQSKKYENMNSIGNLLPLSGKINNKAGILEFKMKKLEFENSQLKIVKEFLEKYKDQSEWEENEIIQRTEELAKKAYEEIWNI